MWLRFLEFWRRVFRRWSKRPGSVSDVLVEIGAMNNLRVSWVLPLTRASGAALPQSEIQAVEVALSANGGTSFSVVGQVPPAQTSALVNDLAVGDWIVRLIVIDTEDRSGEEVLTPFAVLDDSPPGIVTDVVIDLS